MEYIFLSKLCAYAWQSDRFVEAARAHTDAFGYDIVLSCADVTRHVQLKASKFSGATRQQNVNVALASKPSGCVLWLLVNDDTLEPRKFLWFGDQPHRPLPELGDNLAKHTKANADGKKTLRPALRTLSKSKFETLNTIDEVFSRLFGMGD